MKKIIFAILLFAAYSPPPVTAASNDDLPGIVIIDQVDMVQPIMINDVMVLTPIMNPDLVQTFVINKSNSFIAIVSPVSDLKVLNEKGWNKKLKWQHINVSHAIFKTNFLALDRGWNKRLSKYLMMS